MKQATRSVCEDRTGFSFRLKMFFFFIRCLCIDLELLCFSYINKDGCYEK